MKLFNLLMRLFKPKRILIIDLDKLEYDPSIRVGWVANIAMSVKDSFQSHKFRNGIPSEDPMLLSDDDIHEITNAGAEQFIDLLTYDNTYSEDDYGI